MATTITLQRTGASPLRFTGELVAEADNETVENNRWYQIRIYRAGAKYVTHIGFRTRWESERDHDVVEVVDAPGKVAEVLQRYDVLPENRGYPPTPVFAERQARLRNALQRDYGLLVSEILDDELFLEDLGDESEYPAEADLEVIREFLAADLADMPLTEREACAICDANNGAMLLPHCWMGIGANLVDSVGLDKKWGVDVDSLARRVSELSRSQLLALTLGIVTFWRNCNLPTRAALEKAGFSLVD